MDNNDVKLKKNQGILDLGRKDLLQSANDKAKSFEDSLSMADPKIVSNNEVSNKTVKSAKKPTSTKKKNSKIVSSVDKIAKEKEKAKKQIEKERALAKAKIEAEREKAKEALKKQKEKEREAVKAQLAKERQKLKEEAAAKAKAEAMEIVKKKGAEEKAYLDSVKEQLADIAKQIGGDPKKDDGIDIDIHKGDNAEEKQAVVDTLQKLREKVQAQKRLEKEMMEKEATRIQKKDLDIINRINEINRDFEFVEDDYVSSEELAEEKEKVKNLETIIQNILGLKYKNVSLLNSDDFSLNNEFIRVLTNENGIKFDPSIGEVEDLKKAYGDLELTVRHLNEENQELKNREIIEKTKYEELVKNFEQEESKKENYLQELTLLRYQINQSFESVKLKEAEIDKLKDEVEDLKKPTSEIEANLIIKYAKKIEAKEQDLYSQFQDLQFFKEKELEITSNNIRKEYLGKLKDFEEEKNAEIDLLKEELNNKTSQIELLEKEMALRLDEINQAHEMEVTEKENQLKLVNDELENKRSQIESLEKEIALKLNEINLAHEMEVTEKDNQLKLLNDELNNKTSQIESLEKEMTLKLGDLKTVYEMEVTEKDNEINNLNETISNIKKEMNDKLNQVLFDHEKEVNEIINNKDYEINSLQIKLNNIEEEMAVKYAELISNYDQEISLNMIAHDDQVNSLKKQIIEIEEDMTKKYQELVSAKDFEIAEAKDTIYQELSKEFKSKEEKYILEIDQGKLSTNNESIQEILHLQKEIQEAKVNLEKQKVDYEHTRSNYELIAHEEIERLKSIIDEQNIEYQKQVNQLQNEINSKDLEYLEKIKYLELDLDNKRNEVSQDEVDKTVAAKIHNFLRLENDGNTKLLKKNEDDFNKKLEELEVNFDVKINELKTQISERDLKLHEKDRLINSLENNVHQNVEEYNEPVLIKQKQSDYYLEQINQLREEIEELKRNRITETQLTLIPAEIARLRAQFTMFGGGLENDALRLIKEVREEIKRNREEIKLLSKSKQEEINDITNTYQSKLDEEQQEKIHLEELNRQINQKVKHLTKEIEERNNQLDKLDDKFNQFDEDEIADPEFRRKIRTIRTMQDELTKKADEEEDIYNNSIKNINTKIEFRKQEIKSLKDRLNLLEKEFFEVGDYSSESKNNFEKARYRLNVEIELQETRLHQLIEEDSKRVANKYQTFIKDKRFEMNELRNKELELMKLYQDKRQKELASNEEYIIYKQKQEEKDELQKQLDELKISQQKTLQALEESRNDLSKVIESHQQIKNQLNDDYKFRVSDKASQLQASIKDLTNDYNIYANKIKELKKTQDERINLEKKIRYNETIVNDYYNSNLYLQNVTNEFHSNKEKYNKIKEEINALQDDPSMKSEMLKAKAKLQDLEILQSDLSSKIDYTKRHIHEISSNEKVVYYIDLLKSMEKLKSVYLNIKNKMDETKSKINSLNIELDSLK